MNNMSGMDMSSSTMMSSMDMSTSTMTSMGMSSSTMMPSMDMSSSTMMMSSMDMSSSSMVSMSNMNMATATSSMSATSTNMSGMVMATSTSSSDSSDSADTMRMSMWMTSSYSYTPVFFKSLEAHSGAAAFGIFCVLFFSSFFFRGLLFLSSYLEQAVFRNYANVITVEECECGPLSINDDEKQSADKTHQMKKLSFGQILKDLFWISPKELFHDIIRLLLAFTTVMFAYALMLASMSLVVLYFFAICLGLAFGEVFFNRLSIILGINKAFGVKL